MAQSPRQPGPPATVGARIQPAEGRDENDLAGDEAAWATETQHLPGAKNIDRLAADLDLITTLALSGFTGRDYDYFASELAKYGVAVISGWIRRGVIFAKVRSRGFGGLPGAPDGAFADEDVIADLTHETVAKALRQFRQDVLLRKQWDSTRGATIRTFFIGQCLIRFANVYRTWWNRQPQARVMPTDLDSIRLMADNAVDSPEHQTVNRQEILRGLRLATNDNVRRALTLTADGFTQREIATELAVTEKAVERMINNHLTRMRERGIA
jgi:DNA-directed RNA polymerase specialized sigma24 family protein